MPKVVGRERERDTADVAHNSCQDRQRFCRERAARSRQWTAVHFLVDANCGSLCPVLLLILT